MLAKIPVVGSVAVIVACPVLVPLPPLDANPLVPAALLIVATFVFDELQLTAPVRSWVELSV